MPDDLRTELRHAFQDFMALGFPALGNTILGFAEAHAEFAGLVARALAPVVLVTPGEIPQAALTAALRAATERACMGVSDPAESEALRECVATMDRVHELLVHFAGGHSERKPEHE